MKSFFHSVKETFTSRTIYQRSLHMSVRKPLGLLFKAVICIGVVLGVIGVVVFLVAAPSFKRVLTNYAQNAYPDDLVVTIANGVLTTNSAETVAFPVPVELRNEKVDQPSYMWVIAPEEVATPSVLTKYDSFAVMAKDGVVAGTDQQIRMYPYRTTETPTVITKASVIEMTRTINKVGGIVAAIGIIPFAILFVLFKALAHLVLLVVITAVLWCVFRARNQNFSYKQIYKAGMYALVPLLILEIALVPLGIAGGLFTFVFVSVIVLAAMHTYKHPHTVESVAE